MKQVALVPDLPQDLAAVSEVVKNMHRRVPVRILETDAFQTAEMLLIAVPMSAVEDSVKTLLGL